MGKIKDSYVKHREIVNYLFFGVLTTFVGWAVYFSVLLGGKAVAGIPAEQTEGGKYLLIYTVAQIVQWIAAVLFAYFTNRRWVFTDADKSAPILPQLGLFAAGRLATLGLDYAVTLFGGIALSSLLPRMNGVEIFGRSVNLNEVASKVVAAVIVIVGNYAFSKLLVFRQSEKRRKIKKKGPKNLKKDIDK